MTYRIVISDNARREIRRLDTVTQERIAAHIAALGINPRPPGFKKLRNREGYRIRAGDYRIVYEIDDDIVTVIILRVAHRSIVYRRP